MRCLEVSRAILGSVMPTALVWTESVSCFCQVWCHLVPYLPFDDQLQVLLRDSSMLSNVNCCLAGFRRVKKKQIDFRSLNWGFCCQVMRSYCVQTLWVEDLLKSRMATDKERKSVSSKLAVPIREQSKSFQGDFFHTPKSFCASPVNQRSGCQLPLLLSLGFGNRLKI